MVEEGVEGYHFNFIDLFVVNIFLRLDKQIIKTFVWSYSWISKENIYSTAHLEVYTFPRYFFRVRGLLVPRFSYTSIENQVRGIMRPKCAQNAPRHNVPAVVSRKWSGNNSVSDFICGLNRQNGRELLLRTLYFCHLFCKICGILPQNRLV